MALPYLLSWVPILIKYNGLACKGIACYKPPDVSWRRVLYDILQYPVPAYLQEIVINIEVKFNAYFNYPSIGLVQGHPLACDRRTV
jgi:hypothetical protein